MSFELALKQINAKKQFITQTVYHTS